MACRRADGWFRARPRHAANDSRCVARRDSWRSELWRAEESPRLSCFWSRVVLLSLNEMDAMAPPRLKFHPLYSQLTAASIEVRIEENASFFKPPPSCSISEEQLLCYSGRKLLFLRLSVCETEWWTNPFVLFILFLLPSPWDRIRDGSDKWYWQWNCNR